LDILAGFLGHNIRVHRNFYRLPQETLQLAKVSKILLVYDRRRQTASYKGKNLDEIQLDDVVEMDDAEVSDTAEDDQDECSQSEGFRYC